MGISFDQALGSFQDTLRLRGQRAELLATNLANADTPGYKAKDLDFASLLKGSMEGSQLPMAATSADHIQPVGINNMEAAEMYRIPLQSSVDGNTVNTSMEKTAFTKNAVEYQATLEMLGGRFKSLIGAIRGE